MTIINWTISQLDCKPQEDGLTDVVVTAHWECLGATAASQSIEQAPAPVTARVYGTANFTLQQGAGFTPYEQLTQDQVLGWVWSSGVDKDATEAVVQQQIDNQVNPPVIQPPLPWTGA